MMRRYFLLFIIVAWGTAHAEMGQIQSGPAVISETSQKAIILHNGAEELLRPEVTIQGDSSLPTGSPLVAGEPGVPHGKQLYAHLTFGASFSCDAPADWLVDKLFINGYGDRKMIRGLALEAPRGGETPPRIELAYIANGDTRHPTPESFVQDLSRPVTLSEPATTSHTSVAGQKSTIVLRSRRQFVPFEPAGPLADPPGNTQGIVYEQQERMARQLVVRERYVIVPATAGFHVLSFSAPDDSFDSYKDVFDRVLSSFVVLHQ